MPGVRREHGAAPQPQKGRGKIAQGRRIGDHSGNGGTLDLLAGGQEDKHKERVQHNVEHAAQTKAKAGLAGAAHTAEQVGHGEAQHGGQTADHHHPEGVAGGVVQGVGAGPQDVQQRLHEEQAKGGVAQRHYSASATTAEP